MPKGEIPEKKRKENNCQSLAKEKKSAFNLILGLLNLPACFFVVFLFFKNKTLCHGQMHITFGRNIRRVILTLSVMA